MEGLTTRRVLVLDGGGVKGLSTLLILQHIMDGINEGLADNSPALEPWQIFHLIGGTSTGGIIAIMLGRLRMSVADCIEAYLDLSKRIFNAKFLRSWARSYINGNGKFDAEELEMAVKGTIRYVTGDNPDEVLLRDPDPVCKVCAISTRESNSTLAVFRSYENKERTKLLFDECRVWEACRATSAAPFCFDPIAIGPMRQRFIDGSMGQNNPINVVYGEALDLWPGQDLFLLSLGTGQAAGKGFGQNLHSIIDALQRLVTDTQEKANRFLTEHQDMMSQQRLFRFDVTHGLETVGLEEYKSVNFISDATQHYLDSQEIADKRRKCVTNLIKALNVMQATSTTSSSPSLNISQPSQTFRSIMPPPAQSEQSTSRHSSEGQVPDRQTSANTMQHGAAPKTRKRSASNDAFITHSGVAIEETTREDVRNHPSERKTSTRLVTNRTPAYIGQAFRGRDEIYVRMKKTLNAKATGVVSFGLYGQGGVGKSQIALRYAHENQDRYSAIVWLPSDNEAKIINACEDFVANLTHYEKPAKAEACKNTFLQWMQTSSDYLLIFDNAENISTIKPFLPTAIGCQGRVIITTRDPSIAPCLRSEISELPCFTADESADMLLSEICDEERELALRLGKRLGGLPIALHHVASYISTRRISIQDALEEYEQHDGFMRIQQYLPAAEMLSYEPGMANIWAPTISSLPSEARDLLHLLALFDPDQIPSDLIEPFSDLGKDYGTQNSGRLVSSRDALIPLQNRSLVVKERSAKSLGIHQVLQDHIKHQWSLEERQAAFSSASYCIRAKYPRQVSGTSMAKFYDKCAAYNPHVLRLQRFIDDHFSILQIDLDLAEVLAHCGWYFFERGQIEYAASVLGTADKICTSLTNGELNLVAGLIYNNIGGIYHTKGERKRSADYTLLAVQHRETIRRDDPEIQQLAVCYSNHASNLQSLGHEKEADDFYAKALDIRENCPGSSPELREAILSNICSVMYKRGQLKYAREMAERAMALHKEIQPTTSHMLYTVYCYANMLYTGGDLDQGYNLHRQCLQQRITLEGKDHFMTGVSFHKVGCLDYEEGFIEDAIQNLRSALATFRKATAEKGLLPRTCLKLGHVLEKVGNRKSNITFLDEGLALRVEGKNLLSGMKVPDLRYESNEELNSLVRATYR